MFRNLLWGSVNYGQCLHGLHNTKSLRTPVLDDIHNFCLAQLRWRAVLSVLKAHEPGL